MSLVTVIGPSRYFHADSEALTILRAQREHIARANLELRERGHRLRELIFVLELQGQGVACGHHRQTKCGDNRQENAEAEPAQGTASTNRKIHIYRL